MFTYFSIFMFVLVSRIAMSVGKVHIYALTIFMYTGYVLRKICTGLGLAIPFLV